MPKIIRAILAFFRSRPDSLGNLDDAQRAWAAEAEEQ
jgi:hypothetical protein